MIIADVTITGQDAVSVGIPTGIASTMLYFGRKYLMDGLKRLRFLMGVVMLAAKGVRNAKPVLEEIEQEEMTRIQRKIFLAFKSFVFKISDLADELESVPEKGEVIEERVLAKVKKMLDESREAPRLIVPPQHPNPPNTEEKSR